MDKISEIKQKLQEIVGFKPNLPFTAKVIKVDEATCTIVLSDGLEIPDVKLRATNNVIDNYVLITPKIGSKVTVVSLTGTVENLTVIKVDEAEKIQVKQGELEFLIDGADEKIQVKKGETTLLGSVLELTKVLKTKFKVFTPTGPSGTALPNSVSALTTVENTFKEFLK